MYSIAPSRALTAAASAFLIAATAMSFTGAPASAEPSSCADPTVRVTTAIALQAALTQAVAGDVIALADGVYQGQFVADHPATAERPITVCGSRQAILNAEGPSGGYVLHLVNADYWRIEGITVRHGQKGVILDETDHAVLSRIEVYDTGDEAIHLRNFSSHNLVTGVVVHDTGHRNAKFGEGVYVGSARSNWSSVSGGVPDESDFNIIELSRIYNTTGESVDIKEGTQGGVVRGNHFDGAGLVVPGADSWVDVKGKGWLIEGNEGVNSPMDGFQTHEIVSGWGTGNTFRNNVASVNGPGFGFSLTPVRENTVECSNAVVGAAEGYANVLCVGGEKPTMPDATPTPVPEPTPTPPVQSPASQGVGRCPAGTMTVRTATELADALDEAKAGDVIVVAPGVYRGEFDTRERGTAEDPIWLCGDGAQLVGNGSSGGEVLSFNRSAHWRVTGLALTAGRTGLEIKASNDIRVDGVAIAGIGDEGVAVKSGSSMTVLTDVTIQDVGLRKSRSGYGIEVTGSTDTALWRTRVTGAPCGAFRVGLDAVGTVIF